MTATTLSAPGLPAPSGHGPVRLAGLLILFAFFTYGWGSATLSGFFEGPDPLAAIAAGRELFVAAGLVGLSTCLIVAAVGALLAPVLARHDAGVAALYLATRLLEAGLLGLGLVTLLALAPLSAVAPEAGALAQFAQGLNTQAYHAGMLLLGLGSLPMCLLLHRARLVPAALALWGFFGYALFAMGMVSDLFGLGWGLYLLIPGGLWELAIAGYFILRGLEPRPVREKPLA